MGFYWASAGLNFPTTDDRVVMPREWVISSPLYEQVAANLDADRLAHFDQQRDAFDAAPTLEKCVSEAVYERVREQILPDAPSRLRCLWAALDAGAAMQFAQVYLPPPVFDAEGFGNIVAMPVSTADGKWVALDMHLFEIPQSINSDAETNAAALSHIEDRARRYWSGEQSEDLFVEVLAEKLWQWTAYFTDGRVPPPYSEFRGHRMD